MMQRLITRVPVAPLARSVRASSSGSDNWIPDVSIDTQLVHGGVTPNEETGAVLTPVFMSTTFVQESVDKYACPLSPPQPHDRMYMHVGISRRASVTAVPATQQSGASSSVHLSLH